MFECDCLLNATGRVPNVFGVGLDEAGVDYNNRQGVVIDDYFRSVLLYHRWWDLEELEWYARGVLT